MDFKQTTERSPGSGGEVAKTVFTATLDGGEKKNVKDRHSEKAEATWQAFGHQNSNENRIGRTFLETAGGTVARRIRFLQFSGGEFTTRRENIQAEKRSTKEGCAVRGHQGKGSEQSPPGRGLSYSKGDSLSNENGKGGEKMGMGENNGKQSGQGWTNAPGV